MLAGCGGSQPPIGATGSGVQTAVGVVHLLEHRSWVRHAAGGDLLYFSIPDRSDPHVYVYSYPGGVQVGDLTDFASGDYPEGLCTDSSGDVFVTTVEDFYPWNGLIQEYTHGGSSPICDSGSRCFF
jgi:hypothetical protein